MDEITTLLTRGVDAIYPNREELEKVLRSGKKLKLYQGFDPTGTELHIGHMVGLRKLAQFQKLGHEVIFLIGDFTAMVGDPSGKTTARQMLTKEEVAKNADEYIKQAGRILDFDGNNPIKILYNSDWLTKVNTIELIRISSNLSVQQVIERDLFQNRFKEGNDVYMNEFFYPVMQAYDSVYMDVDLEIGGRDQMFNMMMGRKLMRNMKKKDKFVMTTPLLEDSEGRKIGKTEGNVIALVDSPNDLFGKIMALGDDVIVKGLEFLTDVPDGEIKEIEYKIKAGENPIQFKKKLAFEIVKQLDTEENASFAQKTFESTIQNKEAPTEITELTVKEGQSIVDVLVESGMVVSKSDAKRLLEQGGVEIDGKKLDLGYSMLDIRNGQIIKVGKHKFLKLKLKT